MLFQINKEFKLAEKGLTKVQVARTGTNMVHGAYGKITITKKDLKEMKSNFENNARGLLDEDGKPILQFDFKHFEDDTAAGWIKALLISDDGQKLYASVEFNDDGKEDLKKNRFKFVSPAIVNNFTNNATGKKHKIILKGAALTNIPFLLGMEPISTKNLDEGVINKMNEFLFKLQDSDGDSEPSTVDDIVNMIDELGEEERAELFVKFKLETKKSEVKKMSDQKKPSENEMKLTEDNKNLSEENVKLKDEIEKTKKESEFKLLLSEGKVVPAQEKAFISGDMTEFMKLSEKINLDSKGSGDGEGKESKTAKTKEQAELKLSELAEKECKDDENLKFSDAMKNVIGDKKNADLVKLYETE